MTCEKLCRTRVDWLEELSVKHGCLVHAYTLMTNHVHLLLTAESAEGIGQLMKALGQRYVQYFDRSYLRSGTLWEGCFRSCLLQDEACLLACMRYVELNPVRADMVNHPGEYSWSSYRVNAQGETSTLVRPHALYDQLGPSLTDRQAAYRELLRYQPDPGVVDEIRQATNGNVVLGNARFGEGK